jgi:hypothetical protein
MKSMEKKKNIPLKVAIVFIIIVLTLCAMISCDTHRITDLLKAEKVVEEESTPPPTSESTPDTTPETPTPTPSTPTPTPSTPTPTPKHIQITNPQPPDGATGVGIYPTLCVDVYNPDDNAMDVIFYDMIDQIVGIENNVPSGGRACIQWNGLSCGTTYTWKVTANDGELINSELFSFTTRENQAPDKPVNIQPAYNGGTGINPTLSANVSDPDGDTMDVIFYGKPNGAPITPAKIDIVKEVPSGSRPDIQWSDLSYETEYEWYMEACDVCGACTQSDTVPFNTGQNHAPDTPSNPQPSDGAWEVGTDPDLCVDVSDPDGDPMDVTFYDMMDVPIATATQVPSGGRACVQWNGLYPNESYAWSAGAEDGDKSTKSTQWSFNTGPTPTPGPAVHCNKSDNQIIVFLRNAPACEGGALTKIECDVEVNQNVSGILGAVDWNQYETHVKVWFYCGDGPEFIIQGIDSIPTNFTLNGTWIPIVD